MSEGKSSKSCLQLLCLEINDIYSVKHNFIFRGTYIFQKNIGCQKHGFIRPPTYSALTKQIIEWPADSYSWGANLLTHLF